jgi:23S rRNA (pseudouridine1915-N3)-methyltransferase
MAGMLRLRLLWIGKTKNAAAAAWGEEYLRRAQRFASLGHEELGPRAAQASLLRHAASGRLWLFTPGGRSLDSPAFANWLQRECTRGGKEVVFAIGGADGFSPEVIAQAAGSLSLSALTFSHELARVMALEQIYRALTILNGHPYPR